MLKVIIKRDREERVDIFECNSLDIDKKKKLACFTIKDNGYIDREWYEFSSYSLVTGFIIFNDGNLVSNRYK